MKSLIAFLLLTTIVFGQTITTKNEVVLSGLKNVRQIGDYVIAEEGIKVETIPAVTVVLTTEASNISIKFTDKDRESIPFVKIDEKNYLVTTPGKVWIDVICIDIPKNIVQIEQAIAVVGTPAPPEPTPPPPTPVPPTPDVPTDQFDNIGQRVATWTKGLPSNKEIGTIYLSGVKALRSDPSTTINEQGTKVNKAIAAVPSYTQYSAFVAGITTDITSRWPTMSRSLLADYWAAIALGLGVK